jgi:proteasome lid subunit RPN8/RPN11
MITLCLRHLTLIEARARQAAPFEYCALLFGDSGRGGGAIVTGLIRLRNGDARPGRFAVDNTELRHAYTGVRERSSEPIALLHSHPSGPAIPSAADLAALSGASLPWIIAALRPEGGLDVAGFSPGTGDDLRLIIAD